MKSGLNFIPRKVSKIRLHCHAMRTTQLDSKRPKLKFLEMNDLCVFGAFRLFLPVPFCICFKRVTWIMHILRLQLEGTLLLENVSQEEKGQLDQNADGSLDPHDGSFCAGSINPE